MSEETRNTSATGGQKGTKLARYDLIPVDSQRQIAEHFGKGAAKYASHNWRQGYPWSQTYAALMRHVQAWWDGEDFDTCPADGNGCEFKPAVDYAEGTCYNHLGSHHLAAVGFHALVGLEFSRRFPGFDDRYDPAPDDDKYQTWLREQEEADEDSEEAVAAREKRAAEYATRLGYALSDLTPEEPVETDSFLLVGEVAEDLSGPLTDANGFLNRWVDSYSIPHRFIAGVDGAGTEDLKPEVGYIFGIPVDMTLLNKRPAIFDDEPDQG